MTDREFLSWLHERLEHVHRESPHQNYMYRLRAMAKTTPKEQTTPDVYSHGSLKQLEKWLHENDSIPKTL